MGVDYFTSERVYKPSSETYSLYVARVGYALQHRDRERDIILFRETDDLGFRLKNSLPTWICHTQPSGHVWNVTTVGEKPVGEIYQNDDFTSLSIRDTIFSIKNSRLYLSGNHESLDVKNQLEEIKKKMSQSAMYALYDAEQKQQLSRTMLVMAFAEQVIDSSTKG